MEREKPLILLAWFAAAVLVFKLSTVSGVIMVLAAGIWIGAAAQK